MTGDTGFSDAELVLRARARDKGAFDLLVLRHKGALYRLVRRYVGNDEEAYDLVQDSFISAWLALARFDAHRDFATWLRTIALNKCRDFGRRQAVRRRFQRMMALFQQDDLVHQTEERSAEQNAREDERLRRLDQAIAELPAFYKEPLLLTTLGGLSQQEAARQLNTSTKAVELRIRRAKKRLAQGLSDLAGEG